MTERWPALVVGLMSGTSMDGIDAALIRTDGANLVEPVATAALQYDPEFRQRLRGVLGARGELETVAHTLTLRHAEAVSSLLETAGVAPAEVALIGFHGHTVLHDPAHRRTVQIGDGALLARATGIDTVCDFRSADVAAGGQGAPLAPAYHAAVARGPWPLCFLNIGGVANLTWIGEAADMAAPDAFGALIAFDTGPGNALIDDWVVRHTGAAFDTDGALAARGTVNAAALAALLANPYFDRRPPKSLDRDDFSLAGLEGLSAADGAATLAAFTAQAAARACEHLPAPPTRWIVTGGGRHNGDLMRRLRLALDAPVVTTEDEGLEGDFVEAQAFAYLAARSARGLPLSGTGTTGVPAPQPGGRLFATS